MRRRGDGAFATVEIVILSRDCSMQSSNEVRGLKSVPLKNWSEQSSALASVVAGNVNRLHCSAVKYGVKNVLRLKVAFRVCRVGKNSIAVNWQLSFSLVE